MTNTFNFTKASINALPTPDKDQRQVYRDIKTSGLQLRVTHTGVKTFSVFKRVKHGSPERITLGRYPDLTVEQARAMAAEINATIAKGENPADAGRDSREEPSLNQAFDEYYNDYLVPQGKKTIDDIEANYKRYLSGFANKKLSHIKESDVRKLVNTLGKDKGHATANRTLELLRAIINKAILWKRFKGQNPAVGIEKFNLKTRDRFLHGDELSRLFNALSQTSNLLIRDFVLISLLTGARRANVMAMRWDEISFERKEWRIPDTKNGTPQTVTLINEAVQILEQIKGNGSDWVFPGDGVTGHLVSPKKGWKSLLDLDEMVYLTNILVNAGGEVVLSQTASLETRIDKLREEAKRLELDISRSRLPDLRLHDLRRTMGSWQAKMGASLVVIGKSLNHKSLAATQIYARLDSDPVRESMQNATDAMMKESGFSITSSTFMPN